MGLLSFGDSGWGDEMAMATLMTLTVAVCAFALALIIGNVVAFPIRALRHQLPHYMGIFSPRMGVELLLMGQGLRVVSLLVVGAVYYAIG